MSSADPTSESITSPAAATSPKPPKAVTRPVGAPDPMGDDARVRTEKAQPRPDGLKTDQPKQVENDRGRDPAPTGLRGAFQKHPVAMMVCLGLIVVGLIAGVAWYLHARHYESTDDAFIDGRPVLVSPQVTGSIISVKVTDNQIVKSGDLLATIDPRNYQAAVDQANGQIRQAEATARNL